MRAASFFVLYIKYTEEVVYSIVSRSLPFFVMVGGWKYKIDDPRWPLSGNTGRKSAVDWIFNAKLNILLPQYIYSVLMN